MGVILLRIPSGSIENLPGNNGQSYGRDVRGLMATSELLMLHINQYVSPFLNYSPAALERERDSLFCKSFRCMKLLLHRVLEVSAWRRCRCASGCWCEASLPPVSHRLIESVNCTASINKVLNTRLLWCAAAAEQQTVKCF